MSNKTNTDLYERIHEEWATSAAEVVDAFKLLPRNPRVDAWIAMTNWLVDGRAEDRGPLGEMTRSQYVMWLRSQIE